MKRVHTGKTAFRRCFRGFLDTSSVQRKGLSRRRLALEPLEKRHLLTVATVTASDPNAAEATHDSGSFAIQLADAEEDVSYTVYFTLTGAYHDTTITGNEFDNAGETEDGDTVFSMCFEDHSTSAGLTITPINDAKSEGDHPVTITLLSLEACGGCCCCGPPSASIGNPSSATITIVDDDQWIISVAADANSEAVEADPNDSASFTIRRSPDPNITSGSATDTRYAIAVDFVMSGMTGHALRGTDYEVVCGGQMITSSTIPIPEGLTEVQLTIKPLNDAIKEPDEPVTITITGASSSGVCDPDCGCGCGCGCECACDNWRPGSTFPVDQNAHTASVTILDDDHWDIQVERTSAETIVERGPGEAQFTVTRVDDGTGRSGDLTYGILVDLAMSGLAEQYIDYNLSDDGGYLAIYGDKIVIEDGDTTATFKLTPENDHKREPDEDAVISVENGTSFGLTGGVYGADPSQGSDSVTILDDDWWKVGITDDGDAAEPDDDSWAMYDGKFTLTRTKDRDVAYEMDTSYALQVKVQIPVPDPSADPQTIATYGVDYSLCPGTIYEGENPGELFATFVILQGATTEPIDMSVWNDAKPEENEEVTLTVVGRAPGAGDPQFNVDGAAASATVTIEDNDHWSVTFERGAPSGSEPNAIERLPGVVQDYGYYRATRFDANPGDDYKASDRTYPISLTFETTGTATLNSDYTFAALADTVPGGDLEVIGGPTQGSPVVHGGVTYDTWVTSIPIGLSESYVRVNPIFDWLDEGEPGNRSAAADPDDEANHGEYIDGSLVTAGWSGKPSTYDAVVPTPAEKKRVVIHDGGIIRARTDSDNDGDLDADDDEEEKDANSLGRVIMVNNDQDGANENDRAETTFYVWLDSLTPEAAPVLVDVYVPNALKLKMWDAAAGGTELPFGQDVNPADGRTDEGTRLVTLDATTTSYDETVYVEATDYDAGRLTLNLCADVVSGGPDAADATYYTTLKIDSLAMAFNHDPSDNTGADGVNLRSNGSAGTEHSAPEWVFGSLPFPSPLPNDGAVNQRTVLYLANRSVTTYNRITVDTKYAGMFIKMKARVTAGVTGGLDEEVFEVSQDGILQPAYYCVATKAVNGVDDFAPFGVQNNTSSVVRREEARFHWEVTYIGADVSNGNNTGSNEAVITDPVLMYTILSTPLSPWDVSDDPAADDRNQPWVSALDFAAASTKGNASGEDAQGALAAITNYVYGSRTYAGAIHYALGGTFNYTGYIADSAGQENCLDSAVGLSVTARILGIDLIARRRTHFFDYNYHCFTLWSGSVWDSCPAMSAVTINVLHATYLSWGSPGAGSTETTETWPIE